MSLALPVLEQQPSSSLRVVRRPEWLKVKIPGGEGYHEIKRLVDQSRLHTVCEEARCPNIAECWSRRSATFMILGDVCTRSCGFCAVKTGRPVWLDEDEPRRVAEAWDFLTSGYRTDRQGRQSPYELNIPWYQALNGFDPKDPIQLQVARYLASRSIALVLQGVPGIYLPAIVGSLDRVTDHSQLDEPRSINRTLVTEERLFERLTNPESAYHEVMVRFRDMLSAR
ncbi:hypothetical protein DWB58_29910, partial [candidate division KSB1 bacterium]|nr:hypothetical protein [candidate division KSB1 bacterium]